MMMPCEILVYVGMHFASTLVVLANLMLLCWVTAGAGLTVINCIHCLNKILVDGQVDCLHVWIGLRLADHLGNDLPPVVFVDKASTGQLGAKTCTKCLEGNVSRHMTRAGADPPGRVNSISAAAWTARSPSKLGCCLSLLR